MNPHNILQRLLETDYVQPDPGASGTIDVDRNLGCTPIVTGGAEARTLNVPSKSGLRHMVYLKTDGGDCTLTVTGGYNVAGTTTLVLNDAGDFAVFESIEVGGNVRWRLVAPSVVNDVLSAADLTLNSVNEINFTISNFPFLAIDDAAISGHAAASGTGKSVFAASPTGAAGTTGGAGGAITLTTGAGGATEDNDTGGAGGAFGITGAAGGSGQATGTGGAGGAVTLTGGAGGAATGAGTGGAGGDVVVTPGAGGTTSGGTNGAHGYLKFGSANSFRANSTGNPAFGTGTGPANASGITSVSKWLVVKDSSNGLFAIPLFGLTA